MARLGILILDALERVLADLVGLVSKKAESVKKKTCGRHCSALLHHLCSLMPGAPNRGPTEILVLSFDNIVSENLPSL